MADTLKSEYKKLKGMTLGKKIDYIWTYYRFWFVIIALVLILLISFIKAQVSYNPNAMSLVVIDGHAESDDTSPIFKEINAEFKTYIEADPGDKNYISVDDTIALSADSSAEGNLQAQSIVLQKFLAMIMGGDADLIVAPTETIVYFAGQGIFDDLSETLDADLFNRLLDAGALFEVTIVPDEEAAAEGEVERTFFCGIRLDRFPYLADKGLLMKDMSVGVVINGDHKPLGLDLLDMILGEPYAAHAQ